MSGKTAILKALWKNRNVADAKFDKLYDFQPGCHPARKSGRQSPWHLRPLRLDAWRRRLGTLPTNYLRRRF
jgi:hypothetical protein